MKALAAILVAVSALATVALASTVGGATACGASTASVIAGVERQVMSAVHSVELAGSEVSGDSARIVGAGDLVRAVARGDASATNAAVQRIVYHHYWHIVRLRVTGAAGRLLADFGGPQVISPVPGTLRAKDGRIIGHFLMSVQDDAGFVKLEHRFIGNPAGIYRGGVLVVGDPPTLPRRLPESGHVSFAGVRSLISSQQFGAFPNGTLRLSLLVGAPSPMAARTCALVRVNELGNVAVHLARLFVPLPRHYGPYAQTVSIYTGALVFVRDGVNQLAASAGSGPATLPTSGIVSYQGANWTVFSFAPRPPARIYLLINPASLNA
jgi:hypothetical protein